MSEALCTSELRAQFFTSIEGIYAHQKVTKEIFGAGGRNRTGDNGVTNAGLCQLSYASIGTGAGWRAQPHD